MRFALISPDFLEPIPTSIGLATAVLAREIVGRGHEVVVVVFSEKRRGRFVLEPGLSILPVRPFGRGRVREIVLRWRIRGALLKEARARGLDGVEVPDFEGWLPFRLPGIGVQVRLHNSVTSLCRFREAREGFLMRSFERATLARAERWVGASEYAFARTVEVFGFSPRQKVTLPCPVDLPQDEPLVTPPSGRPRFLFCGPLNWLKGGDLFLRIARVAKDRGIDAEFIVLGNDTQGWAQEGGDLVTCLGRLPHRSALDLMSGATAILAPSRIEFQGLGVMESMARGVPALLPRQAPFSELFSDREVFFVDQNTPEAWVKKMVEVVSDHTTTQIVAQAGQSKVRRDFRAASVTDRWLEMQQGR